MKFIDCYNVTSINVVAGKSGTSSLKSRFPSGACASYTKFEFPFAACTILRTLINLNRKKETIRVNQVPEDHERHDDESNFSDDYRPNPPRFAKGHE